MKYLLSLTLLLASFTSIADSLNISDPWIKNLPPSVPMRAGYMQIENTSTSSVKIVGAKSEVFNMVHIHESIEKDGMMSMQAMPTLEIPAGGSVKLAPGGIHLMLMKPQQTLKPGDQVEITLRFDDGQSQTVKMTVRK